MVTTTIGGSNGGLPAPRVWVKARVGYIEGILVVAGGGSSCVGGKGLVVLHFAIMLNECGKKKCHQR